MTVSIAYFDPGCGVGETVALTQAGDTDLGKTRLHLVDAVTGAVVSTMTVPGQLTSAVADGGQIVGALGASVVRIDRNGAVRRFARTSAVPLYPPPRWRRRDRLPRPLGSSASVDRLAGATVRTLARGRLGALRVRAGTGGRVFLVGQYRELPQSEWGYLDESTTLVTLSVSGNDSRFRAIIEQCIYLSGPQLRQDSQLPGDSAPLKDAEPELMRTKGKVAVATVLQVVHERAPQRHDRAHGLPQAARGRRAVHPRDRDRRGALAQRALRLPGRPARTSTDGTSSVAAQRVSDTTVAVIDGDVAGFVMVAGDEVEQVYVAALHRCTGVADALMAEAERRIARAGYSAAWLAVVAGNTRARRFYERRGWSDAGPFDYAAAGEDGPISVPCRRYVKHLS